MKNRAMASRARLKPELVFGGLAVLSASGGLALALLLTTDTISRLGLFGVGLTAASVFIAILIYFTQARASSESEGRITSTLERIAADTIVPLLRAAESTSQPGDGPDLFPADYARLGVPVPGAEDVLVLERERVPLKLIRDLVVGWEADDRQGRWNIGELRLAFRRIGRGNHSWFLLFERGDGLSLFQVSRGGRGNTSRDIRTRRVDL